MDVFTFGDFKANFYYQDNFFDDNNLNTINQYLDNIDFWYNVNDKDDNIIRKQRWYHKEMKPFHNDWATKYSRWNSFEYDNYLIDLNNFVENSVSKILEKKVKFNSILLNYYENNNNRISPHKDNKMVFGEEPIIVIISIGYERRFMIEKTYLDQYKKDKINPVNKIYNLKNNSIMIMSGCSQRLFNHSILKEDNNHGERYSITFRYHLK